MGRLPSTDPPRTRGAQELLRVIDALRLSRTALAEALEIDPSTLRRILSGERDPTLRQGAAMQRLYGVDVSAWFEGPKKEATGA